ncbi:MAG: DUF4377 domain-containing protein [Nitrosopumilus sp.]|nr:MAG: DUF4377 domain-containing protein [Nitrosopumilus sp.]
MILLQDCTCHGYQEQKIRSPYELQTLYDHIVKFLIIVLVLSGLAISTFAVSPAFAESVETLVIHPHLFDCRDIDGVTQKCMIYKEQNLNPFESWGTLYVPIEGFDYKEWSRYMISVKITDVENSVYPATDKKYDLVEILGQESFPPHDPYNGICAPGFVATTEGNCSFNFRCGPEWSAGRICMSSGQQYLKPLQQVEGAGIADGDVICVEHLSLVSKKSDGSSACVTSETRDVLVKRGEWVKHIPKASVFEQTADPELHAKDFDIPEVRLFLEKYPQAVVIREQVGYANHHKHYMHADRITGDIVGLALIKNIETGDVGSAISCPSNQNHSEGYEVSGTFNIVEYLKNYDCLSDSNVGRFEPSSDSDSKKMSDVQDLENMRKSILELEFGDDIITVLISNETYFGAMTSFEFTTIPVSSLVGAHDRLPETDSNDRMMAGSMLSEIVKAGTYITQNDDKEFWYTIGGIESQVITIELQDHEFDRIVFVSDKNKKWIEQINDIVHFAE